MTCHGCDGSGYRDLCNYDTTTNTCGQKIGKVQSRKQVQGQTSFKCVGTGYGSNNKKCVQVNTPPGPDSYINAQECEKRCNGSPLGQTSFSCEGGQCVRKSKAPRLGDYSNYKECEQNCGGTFNRIGVF
jgi:hypothetical protein